VEQDAVTPVRRAGEGHLVPMLVQYWIAARFGLVWLRLRKGLQPSLGALPGECALVAIGQELPAGRLCRVQGFAARVWWRVGMVAVLLVLPVIGLTAAVRPGPIGTDVAVGLIFVLGGIAGAAMLQMGVLSLRSGSIRMYLLRADSQAEMKPLPPGSFGRPTRWDFWVMLVVALAVFGVLLYAGTHAAHGG
jgi:hypothetical protein